MKPKTIALLEIIKKAHDWQDSEPRGGSGTKIWGTSVCRCCGLKWISFNDPQNHITDQESFTTFSGDTLPISEAAGLGCGDESPSSLPLVLYAPNLFDAAKEALALLHSLGYHPNGILKAKEEENLRGVIDQIESRI